VIGVAALLIGTIIVLRFWWTRNWARRWSIGAASLILGVLFVGTSLDSEYAEAVYTGGALVVIGVVPMVAPRRAEKPELPAPP
jgi:peptidoglycan/LPS O-acetylase OafA/YrhL